jgi:hypothetical protein
MMPEVADMINPSKKKCPSSSGQPPPFFSFVFASSQTELFSSTYYSLRFKTKITFGHNLRYETKGMFGEISLKLRQTNWNVAKNNVNVVVDKLPSQSTNNLQLFTN